MHVQQHTVISTLYENFPTDEDDLDTIVTELQDVTDVLELGLALGLRKSSLDRIMQENTKLQKQMIEVVHYWLTRKDIVRQRQGECPGWSGLADAVYKVNPALSHKIQHQRH